MLISKRHKKGVRTLFLCRFDFLRPVQPILSTFLIRLPKNFGIFTTMILIDGFPPIV